jgi:serine/threonine protein kinase
MPKFSSRPRFVEQFIKEARAAGALNHPNIIQVHDVASENGIHYFSMEYIDGPTAMSLLRDQGTLSQQLACEIIRQTAKALSYAHENRIIHRDIKPDNIMLTSTEAVKLADLGISKTFDEAEAEGKPKRIPGTPHYMAPEASRGNKIDHRIDIYSLGVTLYQLLSGKTPFDAVKASEVLKAHIRDIPEDLQQLVPDLHPSVVSFCNDMMEKDPNNRVNSANEVAQRAKNVLELISSCSDGEIGGETLMLKRIINPGQAQIAENSTPVNMSGRRTSARTSAGDIKSRASRDIVRHRRRKEANPTVIVVRIILILFALILGWIVFTHLRDNFLNKDAANNPPENVSATTENATDQPGTRGGANHSNSETRASRTPVERSERRAVVALGQRIKEAEGAIDLASIIEEAHELLQETPASELSTIQRLNAIITSANTRLSSSKDSLANAEYNRFEIEINELIASDEFQQAQSRRQSYQPANNERQLMTLSADIELHAKLEELNNINQTFMETYASLNDHLQSLSRKPRYRGNLRGFNDPDIIGTTEKSLSLGIASGGQSSVPWNEFRLAAMKKVIGFSLSDHPNPNAILEPLNAWLQVVKPLRKP